MISFNSKKEKEVVVKHKCVYNLEKKNISLGLK